VRLLKDGITSSGPGGDLGHAADHVELALERVLVGRELVGRGHDELLDVGRVEVGRDADVVLVDRHVAPADDPLALVADGLLEQLLELLAAFLLTRQEAHADAVGARRRELRVDDAADELVGQLEQDSRAVASIGIGTGSATVLEVLERDDRAVYGLVRGNAVELRDHGNATGVMFVSGVVKADPAVRTFWHRRATGRGTQNPLRGLGREGQS
jgi:hypothetical protein